MCTRTSLQLQPLDLRRDHVQQVDFTGAQRHAGVQTRQVHWVAERAVQGQFDGRDVVQGCAGISAGPLGAPPRPGYDLARPATSIPVFRPATRFAPLLSGTAEPAPRPDVRPLCDKERAE